MFRIKHFIPVFLTFAALLFPSQVNADYRVGVDYHATGTDFSTSSFISQYHRPEVRNLVKTQLQGMAQSGAKIIHTRLSFMDIPTRRYPNKYERLGFPPSAQELANIRQYVQDVAEIRTSDGGYLSLYLSPFTHGCARLNFQYASVCGNPTWEQMMATYRQTYTAFFNAIGDIRRGDGRPAVEISYMNGEARLAPRVLGFPATENLDRFITEMYPFFVSLARSKGITPSMYFVVDHGNYFIRQGQNNPDMHLGWINNAISFLSSHNLPVPDRIDFSFYVDPVNGEYMPTISHVLQELRTAYPNKKIGIAETFHPRDPVMRRKIGQAFALASRATGGQLEEVLFWTTPLEEPVAFPFDFASYYLPTTPPPSSPPSSTRGDINNDGRVDINDYNYCRNDFGRTGTAGFSCDINRNGKVDIYDYNIIVTYFGR